MLTYLQESGTFIGNILEVSSMTRITFLLKSSTTKDLY